MDSGVELDEPVVDNDIRVDDETSMVVPLSLPEAQLSIVELEHSQMVETVSVHPTPVLHQESNARASSSDSNKNLARCRSEPEEIQCVLQNENHSFLALMPGGVVQQQFEVYATSLIESEQPSVSVYFDASEPLKSGDGGALEPGRIKPEPKNNPEKTKVQKKRRRRRKCCCCGRSRKPADPRQPDEIASEEEGEEDTTNQDSSPSYVTAKTLLEPTSIRTSGKNSGNSSLVHVREPDEPRRKRVPDRPDKSMSLWSVLKNAMGKDILRTPLPVNFSEPLSMLQRLTEDYEYSFLLDNAAKCKDSLDQICYVAAFTIASYANTGLRTFKPFNPILGETYECDRLNDLGWRYMSEQVSHHPPTAVNHCEGAAGWTCWQDMTMHSKWHMNACDFNPTGETRLKFKNNGQTYSWKKVTTVVHGIIMGSLWVDQVGETVINNQTTGETCKLLFHQSSRKQNKQITGTIYNKAGQAKWSLNAMWDSFATVTPTVAKGAPPPPSTLNYEKPIWTIKPPAAGSEKYYFMTEFACQLNELERDVAPTDSRFRPDQRLMELGLWDEANLEKLRLEEKQRRAGKRWESDDKGSLESTATTKKKPYAPLWFRKVNEDSPEAGYKFTGKYWEQKEKKDWSMCPEIF